MNMDNSSVSDSHPVGYHGHYTIAAGDSVALLAILFSVNEEDLLRANPHITSAEALSPGARIHIPGLVTFPVGMMFSPAERELPFGNGGGAFIHLSPEGGQSVSVVATLPASSYFGAYDLYIVEVTVTTNNIFEGQLFATPDDPPSWAARIDLPFLTSLTPESQIDIRPFNSSTGTAGEVILTVNFSALPDSDYMDTNTDLSITSEDLPLEENHPENTNEDAEVYDEINLDTESQSPLKEAAEEIDDQVVEDIDSLPVGLSGGDAPIVDDLTARDQGSDLEAAKHIIEEPIPMKTAEEGADLPDDNGENSLIIDVLPPPEETSWAQNGVKGIDVSPEDDSISESLDRDQNETGPRLQDPPLRPTKDDFKILFDAEENDVTATNQNRAHGETDPELEDSSQENNLPHIYENAKEDSLDDAKALPEEPSVDSEGETLSLDEKNHEKGIKTNLLYSEDDRHLTIEESTTVEITPTDSISGTNFQAEKILANYGPASRAPHRSKSYSYLGKNRRPVNVLLTATSDSKYAAGIASVQLQPSQIIISAVKLPDPSSLGKQYKYYKAWIIDAAGNKTAVVDMRKILNGVWAGQSSKTTLEAFDLVMITAEEYPHVVKPIGPEILIGILPDGM